MIQLFLWLLVFFPLSVAAQMDLSQTGESNPFTSPQDLLFEAFVIPKQSAPIRETPPTGGFWGAFPGERIGETNTDACYRILEEKQIPHGFLNQTWVKLESLGKAVNSIEDPKGWSYWGETFADESPNFNKLEQPSKCPS